jgi:5-methylcytosine-specific restriction endonuclease McrA
MTHLETMEKQEVTTLERAGVQCSAASGSSPRRKGSGVKNQPIECVTCGTEFTPWRRDSRTLICRTCQSRTRHEWSKVRRQRVIEMLFELAMPSCAYCDEWLTMETYTLDHRVAQSRGGGHERTNLVWACGPCNLRKMTGDPR